MGLVEGTSTHTPTEPDHCNHVQTNCKVPLVCAINRRRLADTYMTTKPITRRHQWSTSCRKTTRTSPSHKQFRPSQPSSGPPSHHGPLTLEPWEKSDSQTHTSHCTRVKKPIPNAQKREQPRGSRSLAWQLCTPYKTH